MRRRTIVPLAALGLALDVGLSAGSAWATPEGATAQAATTSAAAEAPRVELITIGPGDYLYARWGHAALRVIDARSESDSAYNFGGIDIGDGFFLRMLRGDVRGFMFETSFADLLSQYSGEDRTITRRSLALAPDEARLLAARLDALARAPRSLYAYHHFNDNCSTRVADEIDRALSGKLRASSQERAPGTYRSRVLRPVKSETLLYVALDLAYSGVVDRPLTRWDTRFLPDAFEPLLDRAMIDGRSLVTRELDVYRSLSMDPSVRWTWPWVKIDLFILAPLLLLTAWRPRAGAILFGLLAGLLGSTFVVLWTQTTYDFFHGNWNIVTFPPTHLFLAAIAARRRIWTSPSWIRARRLYLFLHAGLDLVLLALFASGALNQAIGPAIGFSLPLALVLAFSGARRDLLHLGAHHPARP